MNPHRKLPPLPPNMRHLPVDAKRGLSVPYFVLWEDGIPDFRISDMAKMRECTLHRLCMICGKPMAGDEGVFAMGPLNVIQATNDEPPMHQLCAEYSAQVCPWMLRPGMKRIDKKPKPEGTISLTVESRAAEYKGAPQVWALYHAEEYMATSEPNGTMMYYLGAPTEIHWWREGRRATRDEVITAMAEGRAYLAQHEKIAGKKSVQRELDSAMETLGAWLPESEA
jgi:hypothetical protein